MKVIYKNKLTNLVATMAQSLGFNNAKRGKLKSSNVQDAIDELSERDEMISDAWDSTKHYVVGDYCISDNKLWRCKVDNINSLPTNNDNWMQDTIGLMLKRLGDFANGISAIDYDGEGVVIQLGDIKIVAGYIEIEKPTFSKDGEVYTWLGQNLNIPYFRNTIFNSSPRLIITPAGINDSNAYCTVIGCVRGPSGINILKLMRPTAVSGYNVSLQYVAIGK